MLTFIAGTAADVFGPGPFADTVAFELRSRFSFEAAALSDPYQSEPVEGTGWRDLQKLASSMLSSSPHLSGVDAYQAVYIPATLPKVEQVVIPNAADPLQVASLTKLIDELTSFAQHASLPTDDLELMSLAAKYLEDDTMIDRELDLQTYVQLMLTAKQAVARRQALWIVV